MRLMSITAGTPRDKVAISWVGPSDWERNTNHVINLARTANVVLGHNRLSASTELRMVLIHFAIIRAVLYCDHNGLKSIVCRCFREFPQRAVSVIKIGKTGFLHQM